MMGTWLSVASTKTCHRNSRQLQLLLEHTTVVGSHFYQNKLGSNTKKQCYRSQRFFRRNSQKLKRTLLVFVTKLSSYQYEASRYSLIKSSHWWKFKVLAPKINSITRVTCSLEMRQAAKTWFYDQIFTLVKIYSPSTKDCL